MAFLIVLAAVFLVSPALAAKSPAIALSPGTGVPGTTLTVKGSGFANGEGVDVTFDGSLAGKATTNNRGTFSLGFMVSKSLAPGPYLVKAVGETSNLAAQAVFTVKDPVSIVLSPPFGPTNTAVTVTGTLFKSKESVNLYFDGTLAALAVANASGNFSQSFLVPASAGVGPHTVTAVGQTSSLTAQAAFVVTAPAAPAVTLNPGVGPPTTQTAVTGANFGKNEVVDIYFDTTDLVLASTSGSGAFTQNLQVPAAAAPGQHWITAVGRASGLSAQIPFTVQTDWAQFRYGPRHSGYNPFENVLSPANVSGLGQTWTATTGSYIESSPAVANGVVYVGSWDNKLYAFNAGSGATLWTATTGFIILSSPAVANGVVYVGSYDSNLYAFNAASGAPLWTAATGDWIYSSPAVANGVVYVGSVDGKLYAFNAGSGALLWTAITDNAIYSSPAVANGVVYVGSYDGKLYAFNAASGAQLWAATTGNAIFSSPAVANGVVYVASWDTKLYAFNASTGATLWTATTGGSIDSSPAVANGVVYVGSGDKKLYAFNAASGAQLWTATTGSWIPSSPAVANGVVYVGSLDGKLYAFDATKGPFTGQTLWTATTGGSIESSPAVANGVVYVGSGDGKIYAYNLAAGMAGFAPLTSTATTAAETLAAPAGPPSPADLKPDHSLKLE